MTTAAVIVPTARRPGSARRLAEYFISTGTSGSTALVLAVDSDDPELAGYQRVQRDHPWVTMLVTEGSPHRIGPIINDVAGRLLDRGQGMRPDFTGFMGDDHVPRTAGWDAALIASLCGQPGVAYGNDLNQGERLATACLIDSRVVAALGYFVPPVLEHLYFDDFWMAAGRATTLVYSPDVIVEHMHPTVGKAPMDAGYEAAGCSPAMYARDGDAYRRYLDDPDGWGAALKRLEGLR